MWKNVVEQSRPQMTIRQVRFACWVPKATNTHIEYVICIAFPQQQWLHNAPRYYVTHTLLNLSVLYCGLSPAEFACCSKTGRHTAAKCCDVSCRSISTCAETEWRSRNGCIHSIKSVFWLGTFRSWCILSALTNSVPSAVHARYS